MDSRTDMWRAMASAVRENDECEIRQGLINLVIDSEGFAFNDEWRSVEVRLSMPHINNFSKFIYRNVLQYHREFNIAILTMHSRTVFEKEEVWYRKNPFPKFWKWHCERVPDTLWVEPFFYCPFCDAVKPGVQKKHGLFEIWLGHIRGSMTKWYVPNGTSYTFIPDDPQVLIGSKTYPEIILRKYCGQNKYCPAFKSKIIRAGKMAKVTPDTFFQMSNAASSINQTNKPKA